MTTLKEVRRWTMTIWQAYKPTPGDKDKSGKLKKTKPSKHTLKFKKMFGEKDDVNEIAPLIGLGFAAPTVAKYVSKVNPSSVGSGDGSCKTEVDKVKQKLTTKKKKTNESDDIDERTSQNHNKID